MKNKHQSNNGIIIGDASNVSAANIAVGDGATINSGSATSNSVMPEFDELRKLLSNVEIKKEQKEKALDAIKTIEGEADKGDKANGKKIRSAVGFLENLGKASSSLFPLVDRLIPLVKSFFSAFF